MPNHQPSAYPTVLLTHLRIFTEHKAQFERSVAHLRRHALEEIFQRHPDLEALACQLSVNPCSEEVNSEFAGVFAAGTLDRDHAATDEIERLLSALERAADALWAGDCLEVAVLVRRDEEHVEITEHDPRRHPASRLLDLVEDGEAILFAKSPKRQDKVWIPARRIVLTLQDVIDLAAGSTINVLAGPHDQEINVYGEDFDSDAIMVLRSGGECEIEGFRFIAEQLTPTADIRIGEGPAG